MCVTIKVFALGKTNSGKRDYLCFCFCFCFFLFEMKILPWTLLLEIDISVFPKIVNGFRENKILNMLRKKKKSNPNQERPYSDCSRFEFS